MCYWSGRAQQDVHYSMPSPVNLPCAGCTAPGFPHARSTRRTASRFQRSRRSDSVTRTPTRLGVGVRHGGKLSPPLLCVHRTATQGLVATALLARLSSFPCSGSARGCSLLMPSSAALGTSVFSVCRWPRSSSLSVETASKSSRNPHINSNIFFGPAQPTCM